MWSSAKRSNSRNFTRFQRRRLPSGAVSSPAGTVVPRKKTNYEMWQIFSSVNKCHTWNAYFVKRARQRNNLKSPRGFETMTSQTPVWRSNWGNGFESGRGLRIFYCLTLITSAKKKQIIIVIVFDSLPNSRTLLELVRRSFVRKEHATSPAYKCLCERQSYWLFSIY